MPAGRYRAVVAGVRPGQRLKTPWQRLRQFDGLPLVAVHERCGDGERLAQPQADGGLHGADEVGPTVGIAAEILLGNSQDDGLACRRVGTVRCRGEEQDVTAGHERLLQASGQRGRVRIPLHVQRGVGQRAEAVEQGPQVHHLVGHPYVGRDAACGLNLDAMPLAVVERERPHRRELLQGPEQARGAVLAAGKDDECRWHRRQGSTPGGNSLRTAGPFPGTPSGSRPYGCLPPMGRG